MSKTTVSLQPVPSGAVLLREGEQADLLYRIEGGSVTLARGGATILVVGSGGLVGAAGALLGGPQLFTATGADRASFAKKYLATDLADLLASDEEAAGMLAGALETELALVEARIATREPSPRQVDATATEAGIVLGDIVGSQALRVVGEGLARVRADGAAIADAALAARAMLRTVRACQEIYSVAAGRARAERALTMLRERAKVLQDTVARLS